MKLEDLKPHLGARHRIDFTGPGAGGEPPTFTEVKPTDQCGPDSLTWIAPYRADKNELAASTKARIILCDFDLQCTQPGKWLIRVENPRLVFVRIVGALFTPPRPQGIHPSAVIDPGARIHPSAYVGPFCRIGKAEIGEGSVLLGNNYVYDNVRIGAHVTVGPGSVLGSEGYGYQKNEKGEQERFPHVGGVRIEDQVDIGANTCVDRGTLADTVIKRGAKVGNLCNIGHNAVIGEHTLVTGGVLVSGSTTVEGDVWLAPNTTVTDRVRIGAGAVIGIGATVQSDVPPGGKLAVRPSQLLPAGIPNKS